MDTHLTQGLSQILGKSGSSIQMYMEFATSPFLWHWQHTLSEFQMEEYPANPAPVGGYAANPASSSPARSIASYDIGDDHLVHYIFTAYLSPLDFVA